MALDTNVAVISRNAAVNAVCTLANGGKMQLYDGTQPAAGGAITTQNKLVEWTLPNPAFNTASGGTALMNSVTPVLPTAAGTATWARFIGSTGTILWDWSVGNSSSYNIAMSSASILSGVYQSLTSIVMGMSESIEPSDIALTVPAGLAFSTYDPINFKMVFDVTHAADVGINTPDSYAFYKNGVLITSIAYDVGVAGKQSVQIAVPEIVNPIATADTWEVYASRAGTNSSTSASITAQQPAHGWAGPGLGTNSTGLDFRTMTTTGELQAAIVSNDEGNTSLDLTYKYFNTTTKTWGPSMKRAANTTYPAVYLTLSGTRTDIWSRVVIERDNPYSFTGTHPMLTHYVGDPAGTLIPTPASSASAVTFYANGTGSYIVRTYLRNAANTAYLVFDDASIASAGSEWVDGAATDVWLRTTALSNGIRVRCYMALYGKTPQLMYDHNYTDAAITSAVIQTDYVEVCGYNDNNGTNIKRIFLMEYAAAGASPSTFASAPTTVNYVARSALVPPTMGVFTVDPNDYVNDAAFRAALKNTSTLYDPAQTSKQGTNSTQGALEGLNVDLYTLDTSIKTPSNGNTFRFDLPNNKTNNTAGQLWKNFPLGVFPDAAWLEQEVRFSPTTFTTVGNASDPLNASQGAAYKLGPMMGVMAPATSPGGYNGRTDFEVANGSGTAGVDAVAQYTFGSIPLYASDWNGHGNNVRVGDITSGSESGSSTGTAFTDGLWRKICRFVGKLDSTHMTDRVWIYKYSGGSWALESYDFVTYQMHSGAPLPVFWSLYLGGLNYNRTTGTNQNISLNRGRARVWSYAEYNKTANPMGVPSGNISDLP